MSPQTTKAFPDIPADFISMTSGGSSAHGWEWDNFRSPLSAIAQCSLEVVSLQHGSPTQVLSAVDPNSLPT